MLARHARHHLTDAHRALGWEIEPFIAPNHAAHAVLALWHRPEPAPEPPTVDADGLDRRRGDSVPELTG